jgi:hypothetical protein
MDMNFWDTLWEKQKETELEMTFVLGVRIQNVLIEWSCRKTG